MRASESLGGIEYDGDISGDVLIPASEAFFLEIVTGDFVGLESAMAQDCRLQEGMAGGRSLTGSDKVIEKLKDVSERLNRAGFKKAENVVLMRNQTQTRFLLRTKIGFMSLCLGWLIDWSCGLVTRLVIDKNPSDEAKFMFDDTVAPTPGASSKTSITSSSSTTTSTTTASVASPTAIDSVPHDQSSDASEVTTRASIGITEAIKGLPAQTEDAGRDSERRTMSVDESTGDDSKQRWRPGKYVKEFAESKRRSKKIIEDSDASAAGAATTPVAPPRSCDYKDIAAMMKADLQPPYLVPQPPALAPMLKISVLNCHNLASRRVRILERPVNAYVVVSVASHSHRTPVCPRTSNPDFTKLGGETSFIFETPNTIDFRQQGFVEVEVRDSYPIGDAYDLLASLRVPMIALKSVVDSSTPAVVHLKLNQLGKFHKFGRNKSAAASSSPEESYIELAMSKIDIMQWWVLEEVRAREEAEEARRREERLKRKAAAKIVDNSHSHMHLRGSHRGTANPTTSKSDASRATRDVSYDHTYERRSSGTGFKPVPKEAWMDSENCLRCGREFTFFERKHHCRFCGQVVCDPCSPYELAVNTGEKKRACDLCFVDGTKELMARGEAALRESESQLQPAASSDNNVYNGTKRSTSNTSSNATSATPSSTPSSPYMPSSSLGLGGLTIRSQASDIDEGTFYDAMGSPRRSFSHKSSSFGEEEDAYDENGDRRIIAPADIARALEDVGAVTSDNASSTSSANDTAHRSLSEARDSEEEAGCTMM